MIGPQVALIDPLLTLNLPAPITAGTGMDALAHAIECYTCAYAQAWPDAVALQAEKHIARLDAEVRAHDACHLATW